MALDHKKMVAKIRAERKARRVAEVVAEEVCAEGTPTIPTLLSYTARKVTENITKVPLEDKALREALYNYLQRFV